MDVINDGRSSLQDVKDAFQRLNTSGDDFSLDDVASTTWAIALSASERDALWHPLFASRGAHGVACLLRAIRAEPPTAMLALLLEALKHSLCRVSLESVSGAVLMSVVDVVSNACKGAHVQAFFLPELYYPWLAADASWGHLAVSRACLQGFAGSVVRPLVSHENPAFLLRVNHASYASLLPEMLRQLDPQQLVDVLGAAFWKDSTAKYVLVQKMLTQQSLERPLLLKLLQLLTACLRTTIAADVFHPLARAWSHPDFCQRSPMRRQLQVTRALLHVVALVEPAELHALMEGIHARLEISAADVRRLGMCVAEQWAICLQQQQVGGSSEGLTFDDPQQFRDITEWHENLTEAEATTESVRAEVSPPAAVEEEQLEDPDALVDFGEHEESEDESDSMESFDVEDDRADLQEGRAPVYARDVLAALREGKKDASRLRVALDAAAGVIAARPPDLRDCAASLCSALLHAMDEFQLERFDELRAEALAALVAAHPAICGAHIGEQLQLQRAYSIAQQMVMADCLAAGAQLMVATGATRAQQRDTQASPLQVLSHEPQSRRWGYLSSSRSSSSSATSSPSAASAAGVSVGNSRYTAEAGGLFWPCVSAWRTLPEAPQAQLVLALSTLVELAAQTPEKLRMTRAYLEGPVFCCRWSEVSHTVNSCMLGATKVLRSMSPDTLRRSFVGELNECVEWLESVNTELSKACLGELARHVNR